MSEQPDPVLKAVAALRAAGIIVTPIGQERERWLIGNLTFSDFDVLRLAESCGLMNGLVAS